MDNICEDTSPMPLVPLPSLSRLKSDPDDQQDDNENEEEQELPPDNQTLLRLLEEKEKVCKPKVIYVINCLFVWALLDYIHVSVCSNTRFGYHRRASLVRPGTLLCSGWIHSFEEQRD